MTDVHDARALPISVVIPTYGRADYILASIDSVLTGETVPRELIVVDDGSPDDTAARLAPLVRENRIRYVAQANAGMAAARNAGAALATSTYLYFLDDDDLTYSRVLPDLVSELEQHPDATMACGEMVVFSGEPPEVPDMNAPPRSVDRRAFLRFNPVGSPGQVLMRRSAFEDVGGFRFGYPSTEDWDLWLRLVARYPARWVHRPVMAYRLHDSNASRNVARMYNSSLRVARWHLGLLPASERGFMRYLTYKALRRYHIPRLKTMLVASAANGEWGLANAAIRATIEGWTTDIYATALLKASLAARGRWHLTADERLS